LQVTNDGLFYVLLESTPDGSDHIDVWLVWIRAQTLSPKLRGNLLPTSRSESKMKNFFACAT
jgi:hypothetical protein